MDIVKPFVELLRLVDTNKFIMGKVYWTMWQAINKVKDNEKLNAKERKDIVFCATKIWTIKHTPLQGVAFALDLAFQIHKQSSNNEFMGNFYTVCIALLLGDEGKHTFHQHVQFNNKIGNFSDD